MTDPEALAEKLEDVVAILTLGLGVLAFVLGVANAWAIFVVGWLLLVPLIDEVGADVIGWLARDGADEGSDALTALQDRYASGEIDEMTFERQVEALLETETAADADGRVELRERERN